MLVLLNLHTEVTSMPRRGNCRARFAKTNGAHSVNYASQLDQFLHEREILYESPLGPVFGCKKPEFRRSSSHRSNTGRRRGRLRVYGRASVPRFREKVIQGDKAFLGLGSWDNSLGVGTLTPGHIYKIVNGVKTQFGPIAQVVGGQDSSERVATWDFINPGPPYLQGGSFKSVRYRLPSKEVQGSITATNLGRSGTDPKNYTAYQGGFAYLGPWEGGSTSSYTDVSQNNFPSLSVYHTAAWDKLKPQLAKAGISQFIGELRDLPRMLMTTANDFANIARSFGFGYSATVADPKKIAQSFLNDQFGWAPFVSDLQKFGNLWAMSHAHVIKTVRDNNRWVRKRRVLEQSDTNTFLGRQIGSGTFPNSDSVFFNQVFGKVMQVDGVSCRGFCDTWLRNSKKVWAVGSFKYYRPEFDMNLLDETLIGNFSTVRRLMTLYGARINPSLVWELTPWSWLIDWGINFGSFLKRHEDFVIDGIVSRYLYVMSTEEKYVTKTCVNNFWSGSHTTQFQRSLVKKVREPADSPYGFNAPWNSLSPRQFAILAAIGLSR